MQITINFKNDTIAQKVLWILDRLKSDGVEVVGLDDDDERILANLKEGLREISYVESGVIQAKPIQELLDEL